MATPQVNLTQHLLAEMVLRAGDIEKQRSSGRLQEAYKDRDGYYPDALGLSVIFHPGDPLERLVQSGGPFPHARVSFAIVAKLIEELDKAGYVPLLFITPSPVIPHHHSLAVAKKGQSNPEPELYDSVADALVAACTIVDNPTRLRP